MTVKVFVDTNVLVYAHDIDESSKRAVARDVLRELWNDGNGVVSPQVLQEFYVSVTRKIAVPILKRGRTASCQRVCDLGGSRKQNRLPDRFRA